MLINFNGMGKVLEKVGRKVRNLRRWLWLSNCSLLQFFY